MFDTVGRVKQLAAARGLSVTELARRSGLNHSTFANTMMRGGQLKVETIERLCVGLNITLPEFFSSSSGNSGAGTAQMASN